MTGACHARQKKTMSHQHPDHAPKPVSHRGEPQGSHAHAPHADATRGHSHGHSHAPQNFGLAFAAAAGLNIAFVIIQAIYGVLANSMALIADAGHNFGDVIGLLLAWAAYAIARRPATARYTYGYRSATILAALINAILLLVATGAIAWEAVRRFSAPGEVAGVTVMVVAAIGILINAGSALLLSSGRKGDLNIRGAFLHLMADAAVSAGVVITGMAILFTGWTWLDPLASLVISAVIVWSTWALLRESLTLSLGAVPPGIDPDEVRRYLVALPGVASVHHLHIWAISTSETALTCHLVTPGQHPGDDFLSEVTHALHNRFGIDHPTLQIEVGDAGTCATEHDHGS
jgi:cobalt-zinc-cadmium efflux system protein